MSGRKGWLLTAAIVLLVWLVLSFGFRVLTGMARLDDLAPQRWPGLPGRLFRPQVVAWPGGAALVRSDLESTASTEGMDVLRVDLSTGSIYVYPAEEGRQEARIRADIAASTKAAHDSLIPELSRRDDGMLRFATSPLRGLFTIGTVRATYRIWAPPEMELQVTAANGSITVTGWAAPMRVSTRNGSITLELDGATAVVATTTNGSIAARMGRLEAGVHRLTTTNGAVRVWLSPESGVALNARAGNGSVTLGMPGWVLTDLSRTRAVQAVLGEGGASLTVRTSNGSITVEGD